MLRSSCGSRADLAPDSIFTAGRMYSSRPAVTVGIPEQQALAIRIIRVNDDAGNVRLDFRLRRESLDNLSKLLRERVLDVFAAGVLDRIEPRLALFSAQCFEFLNGGCLSEVLPKYSDVDVFGKSRYQPVGFRERRSALEEKSRMASGQAIEKEHRASR